MDESGASPWKRRLRVFWQYRTLLFELVRRDLKVKYRRSVLGILWTVLHPLGTMLIMTIVFSKLFRFQIENYPVYVLSGNIVFGFFSASTQIAVGSIIGNAPLLKKVYIPKYLFPVSVVLSGTVNFLFSLMALLIVMFFLNMPFHQTMLLIGIPFFGLFLFTLGMALILGAVNVYFRDVQYLYGVLLTAWTYLTPIFYPVEILPDRFRCFLDFNPLYSCLEFFRSLVLLGAWPDGGVVLACFGAGAGTLLLGILVFMRLQRRFILYL